MKRKTGLLALLLMVMLMASAVEVSAAPSGTYLGRQQVVNCREWVSLRSWPSTGADRICTVPLGAIVEAWAYNSEFHKCRYNGWTGYILTAYLAPAGLPGTRYVVNCSEFVTLREWPSTSAPAITRVARGQAVTVYSYTYDGQFCECSYNGYRGYILSYYLGITRY